ncbi:MAG: beta-ketoacyl-[acyl-carrier-protein] synthase family protein [Aureliella sp.]
MPETKNRVVITGLGLASPIGSDLESVWESLRTGKSGIGKIESLDCSDLPFKSGGEVRDFTGKIDNYGELEKPLQRAIKKNMKVMCREIEMGVAVSQKALSHSGLGADRVPERCGCLFGCDYILTRPEEYQDGLRNCRESGSQSNKAVSVEDWPEHGLNKVNPLWLLKYLPNMPNSHVSIYNEFRGPNNAITDRDASMNLAISEATSIIQRGAADVMLVGATGSRLHPLRTPQMILLEQLAAERDDPATMARPFDQSSDGMVLGEGAGAIVLESLEHAEKRSAKIWGEILGCGAAMATNANRGGDAAALAGGIFSAASKALTGLPSPESSWHFHAQGLGTQLADQAESQAINSLCETRPNLTVTAAKSYFGNLGAGSAAVELICSLLALEHGELFPIQNLASPLECNRWSAATSGGTAGDAALHMSFTMEGQVSATLVGKT